MEKSKTKYRVWAKASDRFEPREEVVVEVEDGEDVDEICQDICNDLIANVVEFGWEEVE